MNGQIGIPTDRAGEVAVVFHVQGVVAFELWCVYCLVHALENCEIHCVFKRGSINCVQHFLDFKAAFNRIDFDSQILDEV